MRVDLNASRITDGYVRDNFNKLNEVLQPNPFINGDFRLFTATITGNQTGFKIPHNLKFIPKDAILTQATWSDTVGTISLNYRDATETAFFVTVAGLSSDESVDIRLLLGRIE